MKTKTKKAKQKSPRPHLRRYTHTDKDGVRWRMVGARPVSEIADRVMRDCGLPLRKGG